MVLQHVSLVKIKRLAKRDIMANILLNEFDQSRHKLLRSQLEHRGHQVLSVDDVNDIIATLKEVTIDLMILDLDNQSLDELIEFANRWKGIMIVFQTSCPVLKQDFRSWVADEVIRKCHNGENLLQAVVQLLQSESLCN